MPSTPALAVAALVLLLGAGCRHDGSEDAAALDTTPLTSAELGWIRAFSAWAIDVADDEDASRLGAGRVASCERDVERIGPAPTTRLELAESRIPEVCPLLEDAGTRRRALDLVEAIDDLVFRYLLEDQPLALGSGRTTESRADIELSRRGTEWLEEPVEVRCWGSEDWERVVLEDDAWNDETTDPDDLVGWSDDFSDRIHLVLDYCNGISEIDAESAGGWSRDERLDTAEHLETLLHELQHLALPDADEAKVECSAIRSLPRFAQQFGLSGEVARELAELYRSEIYPELDEEYTEGGCPP